MVFFITLRPWQWPKNLLILLPIFLSKTEGIKVEYLVEPFITLLLFNLLASGNYIINDIRDYEMDKLHPKKKYRPIANGELEIKNAKRLSLLLVSTAIFFVSFIEVKLMILFLIYFFLVNLYTLYVKKLIFLNTILLSIFFLIRLFIGSIASEVELSNSLVIYVFFTSHLLGSLKKKSILSNKRIKQSDYTETLWREDKKFSINKSINISLFLSNMTLVSWSFENLILQKDNFLLTVFIFLILHFLFTLRLYKSSKEGYLEDFILGIVENKKLFIHLLLLGILFSYLYFI